MELEPPPNGQTPPSQSKLMFVSTIVGLALAAFTVVGIPFTLMGLVHVLKSRKENETLVATTERNSEELHALKVENVRLRSDFDRINGMEILERQDEVARLNTGIDSLNERIVAAKAQAEAENQRISDLRKKVVDLKDMVDLNDFGLYNFENPAADSVRYGEQLQKVREQIRAKVKAKTATSAATEWTVNGSAAQGRTMVNNMSKLLLRAFNAEAENCIKTVKAGHLTAATKRLEKSAEAVARLGKSMSIRITNEYLRLREEELALTHAHLEATKTGDC